MTVDIDIDRVRGAIIALDNDLATLTRAIKHRQTRLRATTCRPGATGVLCNLRPQYLVGAPFTVVPGSGRRTKRVQIRLDQAWLDLHPQAKARWSGEIGATVDMLQFDE